MHALSTGYEIWSLGVSKLPTCESVPTDCRVTCAVIESKLSGSLHLYSSSCLTVRSNWRNPLHHSFSLFCQNLVHVFYFTYCTLHKLLNLIHHSTLVFYYVRICFLKGALSMGAVVLSGRISAKITLQPCPCDFASFGHFQTLK